LPRVTDFDRARFWSRRPTLVTGATGLLGGWLLQRLSAGGARVIALVRPGLGDRAPLPPDVVPVIGDVRDQALLERALVEHGVRTVMHVAAQAIVGAARRDPVATFEVNVQGTWAVLEACRRAGGVEQVLLASSDKAYGEAARLPYVEDTPLLGRQPYEASKACADLLGQSYAHTYGLPLAITRCGNYFGGGDRHWNRIVPGTIRAVLRGERPLIRTDGLFVRDYFHVDDGAAAYVALAEALAQRPELRGQAFNFSYETPLTSLELVRRILRLMGSDLEPEVLGEPADEIRAQILSAEKARRVLGWRPLHTLDEGLRLTIAWYREHLRDAL
jgi:CDP-glucose 4,6-dehydratase